MARVLLGHCIADRTVGVGRAVCMGIEHVSGKGDEKVASQNDRAGLQTACYVDEGLPNIQVLARLRVSREFLSFCAG